jgi:hypothetical protein
LIITTPEGIDRILFHIILQLAIFFMQLAKSVPERHLLIITPSVIFFNDFTRVKFEMDNWANNVSISIWMHHNTELRHTK